MKKLIIYESSLEIMIFVNNDEIFYEILQFIGLKEDFIGTKYREVLFHVKILE